MKHILLYIYLLTLISCGTSDKFDPNQNPNTGTSQDNARTTNSTPQLPAPPVVPSNQQPVNNTPPATTVTTVPATTQQTATNNSTTTAKGMNPAHGQPGHRCDIPVGAPLNSKPQTQNTTTNPQQVVVTPQQTSQVKTAPGMNPPHGQPNHRCDIAVGAPLNSKPAAPTQTVQVQPQTSSSTQPIVAPVITDAPKKDSLKN
jgi:hypothetical protein